MVQTLQEILDGKSEEMTMKLQRINEAIKIYNPPKALEKEFESFAKEKYMDN